MKFHLFKLIGFVLLSTVTNLSAFGAPKKESLGGCLKLVVPSLTVKALTQEIVAQPRKFQNKLESLGYVEPMRIMATHPELAARIILNDFPKYNSGYADCNGRPITICETNYVDPALVIDDEALAKKAKGNEAVVLFRGIARTSAQELLFQFSADRLLGPLSFSHRKGIFFTADFSYAERYAKEGFVVTFQIPLALIHTGGEGSGHNTELVIEGRHFARKTNANELTQLLTAAGEQDHIQSVLQSPESFNTKQLYDFRPFVIDIEDMSTGKSYGFEEFLELQRAKH